jgi:hypothetical protein
LQEIWTQIVYILLQFVRRRSLFNKNQVTVLAAAQQRRDPTLQVLFMGINTHLTTEEQQRKCVQVRQV